MIGPGVAAGGCTRSADAGDGKAAMHAATIASFFIIRRSELRTDADRLRQEPSCAAAGYGSGGRRLRLTNAALGPIRPGDHFSAPDPPHSHAEPLKVPTHATTH